MPFKTLKMSESSQETVSSASYQKLQSELKAQNRLIRMLYVEIDELNEENAQKTNQIQRLTTNNALFQALFDQIRQVLNLASYAVESGDS